MHYTSQTHRKLLSTLSFIKQFSIFHITVCVVVNFDTLQFWSSLNEKALIAVTYLQAHEQD